MAKTKTEQKKTTKKTVQKKPQKPETPLGKYGRELKKMAS